MCVCMGMCVPVYVYVCWGGVKVQLTIFICGVSPLVYMRYFYCNESVYISHGHMGTTPYHSTFRRLESL